MSKTSIEQNRSLLIRNVLVAGVTISASLACLNLLRENFMQNINNALEATSNNHEKLSTEKKYIPEESRDKTRLLAYCGPGPIEYHSTMGVDEICFTGRCLVICDEAIAAGMTRIDHIETE